MIVSFLASLMVWLIYLLMAVCFCVLGVYAWRHYHLAYSRMGISAPKDSMELVGFHMPRLTVFIPMHNEERVAPDILQALVDCDYDWDQLEVIPINDRSTDATARIIDEFAARYPIIRPYHRKQGQGGKPAALAEATPLATGEIFLLFDADYVPGRSVLKQLAAPFANAEIGAVMGRVIPHNLGDSLLAGLLSLERSAGYQSVQQSRYNLGYTAQFGGTVGGVRAAALEAVGGWNPTSLTEDTDLTFALLLNGWRTAYVNRAECYEEVPNDWEVRRKQLSRWVAGHTQCLHDYGGEILQNRFLSRGEKLDAILLLAMYLTAPAIVVSWFASALLLLLPEGHLASLLLSSLLFLAYQLVSNQATFLEMGLANVLDGSRVRALLLPFSLLNFFANTGAVFSALWRFYWRRWFGDGGGESWYKTQRSRREALAPQSEAGLGNPNASARQRVTREIRAGGPDQFAGEPGFVRRRNGEYGLGAEYGLGNDDLPPHPVMGD